TTYFLRCVRSANCWDWNESNMITITVIDPQAVILDGYVDPLCTNKSYIFHAKNNALPATYSWKFGPDAMPPTATGTVVNGIKWPTEGVKTIMLTVTIGACVDSVMLTFNAILCACKPPLLDFDALLTADKTVVTSWEVDQWDYPYVSLLERSRDGVDWQLVTNLLGTPSSRSIYHYEDTHPLPGESHYRVRVVDIQPEFEISASKTIFLRTSDVWDLEFHPMPFSDRVTAFLLESQEKEGEVHFFDMKGRLLDMIRIPSGVRTIEIPTSHWPDGHITAYIYLADRRPYARLITKVK
ncbi:MAG: hypothetical protein J5I41_12955, partial [Saprospiraceae bacterium]|nr:hypothetical protein [Saprospiraceae bacterium]